MDNIVIRIKTLRPDSLKAPIPQDLPLEAAHAHPCPKPGIEAIEGAGHEPGAFGGRLRHKIMAGVACAALAAAALGSAVSSASAAPAFTNVSTTMPGANLGPVVWGDYDNDGYPDVLLTGNIGSGYVAQVWRNRGNGTFTNINAGLPGLFKSTAAWGDYDNDGYLDFMMSGLDGTLTPRCEVWHNQRNGTFVKANILLPAVSCGSIAWGDFDNDGKLDILLTGSDLNGKALTQIWRNQGAGSFANMNIALTPVKNSAVAVGDFDNDGYLDILLTGIDTNNLPVAQIWRNLGNGSFTLINAGLTPVSNGSVALGDYDNDGNLDILLTGVNGSAQVVGGLWRNLGNLTFTNVNSGLPPISSGSVAWGDFDNDGKLDVLVSGYNASRATICQIWCNAGGGVFTNLNAGLPGVGSSMAAWGDFNNDGKLDVLISGYNGTTFISQLWCNQAPLANSPPAAPTGLSAAATSSGLVASWQPATDGQTPAGGLTYNLRVGTTKGGSDVLAPAANLATGQRRLPKAGTVQRLPQAILALPPGVYYWSVQAVDSSFAGSPFAPEASIVLGALVTTTPASQVAFTSAYLNGTVNPRGVSTTAWFEWGRTASFGNTNPVVTVGNGTGSLPISQAVLALQPGTTYYYRLVASDAFGLTYGATQTFVTSALTPPALSDFANVSTALSTPTPPIPFTVSSAVVPATSLVVTVNASDSNLVPPANLALSGSGTNRSLTIRPATGLRGATSISVSVSDGSAVTTKSFLLNVGLVPGDLNGDGIVDQSELNSVLSNYWANSPWLNMANFTPLCNATTFQFSLTNATAWNFSVLVSTDSVNWSVLPAPAVPVYQFVDPAAATNSTRHYRLRWP